MGGRALGWAIPLFELPNQSRQTRNKGPCLLSFTMRRKTSYSGESKIFLTDARNVQGIDTRALKTGEVGERTTSLLLHNAQHFSLPNSMKTGGCERSSPYPLCSLRAIDNSLSARFSITTRRYLAFYRWPAIITYTVQKIKSEKLVSSTCLGSWLPTNL